MNYPQRKFDAVIFDQDGTLTDTINIIFQAFVNTVRRFSRIEVTYDELFNAMGPPEEKLLHRYLPEACFPEAEEFFFRHDDEAAGSLSLFPGVAETLDNFQKAGTKLCLFTGMGRRGTR